MFTSINPATGAEIATHPELTDAGVETRLAAADAAYRRWRTTRVEERVALLTRLADAYTANADRLAEMATLEMGKTVASARAEVAKCVAGFRHYATHGPAMIAPRTLAVATGAAEIHWLPLGPVLAVMPWNFPYWQVVRFLAPTLLAGNVGLLKHASNVQGVAGLMVEMMTVAGAPDGLFQNLAIPSRGVAAVIADRRVAAVTLTGSEGAGAAVAEVAGHHLKKVVLELGGSDPFVVMPSANLDAAVAAAVTARIQNSGQSCICGKRMIVHTDIHDAFLARFTIAMAAVTTGDPFDAATAMGPLSSSGARDTVVGQLTAATAQGATLTGGVVLPGPGAFMSAGVLSGIPAGSPILHEEIFGPVAMVLRAANVDQAIALANDSPFGLGSSVWTTDAAEQAAFIAGIDAGMTAINQVLASIPDAPFGGVKRSGHGRELGPWGLHEFMNLKSVLRTG